MPESFLASLAEQTEALREQGLFKSERLISGPQQADIDVRMDGGNRHVLNLCANNYLGLANHPDVIAAAHKALDAFGYGMASVRFICGTQTIHKELDFGAPIMAIEPRLGHEDSDRTGRGVGRRGRHHQRYPESREHHRRYPPFQGAALPLRAR